MGSPSQLSAVEKLRTFFREVLLTDSALDRETADRLARRIVQYIELILARDAQRAQSAGAQSLPEAIAFNPFAFSAVVVLARHGRDALLGKLAEIESADLLRRLADAQHLAIDPALSDPAEIRQAIVSGAAKRIDARRAAAT